jgi:hypothetical protein
MPLLFFFEVDVTELDEVDLDYQPEDNEDAVFISHDDSYNYHDLSCLDRVT